MRDDLRILQKKMKLRKDPNYKGPKKIKTSGHKKGKIFQRLGDSDEIVVRSMPEHYNDANSAAQQPFRNRQRLPLFNGISEDARLRALQKYFSNVVRNKLALSILRPAPV